MGFEEPFRTARLVFEDEDYAGAEVVCRRNVPMRIYFEIAKGAETNDPKAAEDALRLFGESVLVEWNVTRNGIALPADGGGMIEVSPEFAIQIIRAWVRGIVEIPVPLDVQSNSGNGLPVAPIPMVPLSGSQAH